VATEADANVNNTVASSTTSFIVNGTGWSVTLNPIWLNGKAVSLDATKKLVVAAGGSIAISATGYAPNSEVRAYLGTTLLGTFTATGSGQVTGTVKLAETQAVGNAVVTLTGFSPSFKARWVAVGISVKAGFVTKAITITFTGTTTAVSAAANKTLATIVTLVKGAGLVLIDIKGWAAGAKISAALTKLGVTRATNTKTALTKLKVVGTYTTGFGALEKATSKTSRVVITVKYAKP
jgi:outer membrane protein OmpA-like peptidoglycan-associated protein